MHGAYCFSRGVAQQQALLTAVVAKHAADGASSPLAPYLAQHSIDLAALQTAATAAAQHAATHAARGRQAELFREQRDTHFKPVLQHLRGAFQYLKRLYFPNARALGDWGVEVNHETQIVYPKKFEAKHALFKIFKQKHDSFPAGASPLAAFLAEHSISLNNDLTAADTALAFHHQHITTMKDAETAIAQRDQLWLPAAKHLRGMSGFLKKLFARSSKKMGAWGFVVDSSPRAPKLRTSKVLPGAKLVMNGVEIGSMFHNIGETELHVFKGRKISAPLMIVAAGKKMEMQLQPPLLCIRLRAFIACVRMADNIL